MTTYHPMPRFETGPVEVGNNLFAYLQWNGGWGISNAGFLVSDDSLLVIDALMAPSMAHEFVRCMRDISSSPTLILIIQMVTNSLRVLKLLHMNIVAKRCYKRNR